MARHAKPQPLNRTVLNSALNVSFSLIVPVVTLITSTVGVVNGVKKKNHMRYGLHSIGVVTSLMMIFILPLFISNFYVPHAVALKEPKTTIISQYLPQTNPVGVTAEASFGAAEGVTDVTLEEVKSLISKNIEMSRKYYLNEDFKVQVENSDSKVVSFYIFMKDSPEQILTYNAASNESKIVDFKTVDLFNETILNQPLFEKGAVTVAQDENNPDANTVLMTAQGQTAVYGVRYSTDSKTSYAMENLYQIITNDSSNNIKTYDFVALTDKDAILYQEAVKAQNATVSK